MKKVFRFFTYYFSIAIFAFAFFPHLLIASGGDDLSPDSDEQMTAEQSNRLINEKSPYLLQHAHNPVNWYPWGEEAFEKARKEDKPIFLSIGYSTCHWCHVMERESFSNPEIAQLMNKYFVSIKVDREERPDVDQVYMRFVQATTGSGGWPLSVWLTSDLKPFVGGTYFPPKPNYGRPDFPSILNSIAEMWNTDREKILKVSNEILTHLSSSSADSYNPENLKIIRLKNAYSIYKDTYDERDGGFGSAPKFPRPVSLNFLLRYSLSEDIEDVDKQLARDMVLFTLRNIAQGGIKDHVGGGFHRYSVDGKWRVPHFEKMLYNQAQLSDVYLNAYQQTGDPWYGDIAKDILRYVNNQLTDPTGGFYSAEDADSLPTPEAEEKEEGAFYIWTKAEIIEILGEENASILSYHYGIEDEGNAPPESDPRGEFTGYNILYEKYSLNDTAAQFNLSEEKLKALLNLCKERLLHARNKRKRPQLDDKIITAWNGLMISSYARASVILQDPDYLEKASAAAVFIRNNLYQESNARLLRAYRNGSSQVEGFLQDYAYLIQGLIDLYETSFDIQWLQWALQLQEKQDILFWDDTAGGYFTVTGEDASILIRIKDNFDGAIPSPNSIAAMNLLRLSQMIDSASHRSRAGKTLQAFSSNFIRSPQSMPHMLAALSFYLDTPKQIILSGDRFASTTKAMLNEIYRHYLPNKVILLADGAEGQDFLNQKLEILKAINPVEGETTAFVCENYTCDLPTTELATLTRLLKRSR
jgi:uncharacterized protein YyaL (SSP411 family)